MGFFSAVDGNKGLFVAVNRVMYHAIALFVDSANGSLVRWAVTDSLALSLRTFVLLLDRENSVK